MFSVSFDHLPIDDFIHSGKPHQCVDEPIDPDLSEYVIDGIETEQADQAPVNAAGYDENLGDEMYLLHETILGSRRLRLFPPLSTPFLFLLVYGKKVVDENPWICSACAT